MRQFALVGRQQALFVRAWFVACFFPLIAIAADEAVKLDPQHLPWYTWLWVLGLCVIGWLASSAPVLAGWLDDGNETARQVLERRLTIVKGGIAALAAGGSAYLLALYAGTPNLLNFIAVLFAAFGGDAYLRKRADAQSSKGE